MLNNQIMSNPSSIGDGHQSIQAQRGPFRDSSGRFDWRRLFVPPGIPLPDRGGGGTSTGVPPLDNILNDNNKNLGEEKVNPDNTEDSWEEYKNRNENRWTQEMVNQGREFEREMVNRQENFQREMRDTQLDSIVEQARRNGVSVSTALGIPSSASAGSSPTRTDSGERGFPERQLELQEQSNRISLLQTLMFGMMFLPKLRGAGKAKKAFTGPRQQRRGTSNEFWI